MTAFDKAFAISRGNTANVDFGHWVVDLLPKLMMQSLNCSCNNQLHSLLLPRLPHHPH